MCSLCVGAETARHWLLRVSYGYAWYDDVDDRATVGLTFSRLWY